MAQVKKEGTSVLSHNNSKIWDWNTFEELIETIEKAKYTAANSDDEDVGYHGLRMSDL